MAITDTVINSITSGGTGTVINLIIIVGVGSLFLAVFIALALYLWNKKRWNLKAEIKLVRSDGHFISAEWGKAHFNAKRGVVFLKRPGRFRGSIPIKIFDIRKYLQGDNIFTVVQLGPEDYRPVLNTSWDEYEDDKGEKAALINIKVDDGKDKAWKSAFQAAAKKAYSIQSFFQMFQVPIAIAIVLIAVFAGFAMIWIRLPSICG